MSQKRMAWLAVLQQWPGNARLFRRVEMKLSPDVADNSPGYRRDGATLFIRVPVPTGSDDFDNPSMAWAAVEKLIGRVAPGGQFFGRP
jgi:hypothetical protein